MYFKTLVMMAILGILLICRSCASEEKETEEALRQPIELDDDTFEHETQAATGATTGDWFVMFYAPWCGHCQRLKPTWAELANEIGDRVNVAKVNADDSTILAERFDIRGYPTLLFFHRGKYFKYMGDRDLDSLADFALGGYKEESDSSLKVPGDLTNIERLQRIAKKFYDELIFQFNYVFNMFGYAHLPPVAKIIIVIVFLFSPAVVLALLVLI